MDDKELIRKVAEKVMGWVWVDEYHAWIVDSERDADGRLTNCFPDGLDILHDSFGEYVGQEPFDLTNANHWMMVVEAMRKRGYHFDISDNCVSFWKEEDEFVRGISVYENLKDLGMAISTAALKAEGGPV